MWHLAFPLLSHYYLNSQSGMFTKLNYLDVRLKEFYNSMQVKCTCFIFAFFFFFFSWPPIPTVIESQWTNSTPPPHTHIWKCSWGYWTHNDTFMQFHFIRMKRWVDIAVEMQTAGRWDKVSYCCGVVLTPHLMHCHNFMAFNRLDWLVVIFLFRIDQTLILMVCYVGNQECYKISVGVLFFFLSRHDVMWTHEIFEHARLHVALRPDNLFYFEGLCRYSQMQWKLSCGQGINIYFPACEWVWW